MYAFGILYICCVSNLQQERLDTVGAICVDCKGDISAGVSSGGISLKFPGRLGQVVLYGGYTVWLSNCAI